MASLEAKLTEAVTRLAGQTDALEKEAEERRHLEREHRALDKKVVVLERDVKTLWNDVRDMKSEKARSGDRQWQFWLAIIAAALSIATALVVAFVSRGRASDPKEPKAARRCMMGCRIMVVEADATARGTLARVLRWHGHQVVEAGDADQALRAFDAGKFDVMLVDMDIPDRDGLEIVRRVREKDERVGVVMVTGQDAKRVDRECEGLSVLCVLEKPTTNADLKEKVDVAWEYARMPEERREQFARALEKETRRMRDVHRSLMDETKILPPRSCQSAI